jgi:hypothetical protein
MQYCEYCFASIKKSKLASKLDLSRSFTKINNKLHLGIDREIVCPVLARYIPRTIVLAGNGAVKLVDGGCCWNILKIGLSKAGLFGSKGYADPLDALTWLAANHDFFNKTISTDPGADLIRRVKKETISALIDHPTSPREMTCHPCNRQHAVLDSPSILFLTTNWDLGLFRTFPNVIQLHGRCDYPDEAILPLQNISKLMVQSTQDLEKLNTGMLPATFLERCLKSAEHFILWGTKLNDYDAALWHFMHGFLMNNPKVKASVATKNDAESLKDAKTRTQRFFPHVVRADCLCDMLPVPDKNLGCVIKAGLVTE